MAKVVIETNNPQVYGKYSWWQVGLVGAALGVVTLALSWIISVFIVDPLLCRTGTLAACGQSEVLAGNIGAVVSAIIGAGILIRLRVRRSLWVVIAVLATFWGITTLIADLRWAEMAAWMAGLYAVGYLLFANILRIRSAFVAAIIAIIAVLVLRWVAFL